MAQSPQDLIAVCAGIADAVKVEIAATLKSSETRRGQYDRQNRIRLEYGIRVCERIAARIRGVNGEDDVAPPPITDAVKLAAAKLLLRELRPSVASATSSAWRAQTLQLIDDLIDVNPPRS